ncbi:MAG TPA: C4-type zinc ribbon domain-containing protein [Ignavibacteria bacterium]|nr:C4-type zinc ribbon domain-containing protein [Ignavibacteria bacterium]
MTENNINDNPETSGIDNPQVPDTGSSRVLEYFEFNDTENKPKIEEELRILYELCRIDGDLKDINDEKGDLPDIIIEQKNNLFEFENDISGKKAELKKLQEEEATLTKQITKTEAKVKKYDEQKYSAKSNKEYDAIMKSIDASIEIIDKNQKRIKELADITEILKRDIEAAEREMTELKTELEANEAKLSNLNEEFEQEEAELTHKKDNLMVRLEEDLRNLYSRINNTLRGEAVSVVRRGNCSGCYNSIPPQRAIEIRAAEKLFTCQACGRILIDEKYITNN